MIARFRSGLGLVALGLILGACRPAPEPDFPVYSNPPPLPPAREDSLDAMDQYRLAAEETEAKAGDYLTWVSFPAPDRARVRELLAGPLARVERTANSPTVPRFEVFPPFVNRPLRPGWRLLGRAVAWEVERAARDGNGESVVRWTLAGTRLGFAIAAGDAQDATLGFAIVDEVRRACLVARSSLTAEDLARLGDGLTRLLELMPTAREMVDQEEATMLASVQFVQDAFRRNELDVLVEELGPETRNSTDLLQTLRGGARAEYFANFADEARQVAEHWRHNADKPAKDRMPFTVGAKSKRPWWRFSDHFLSALPPAVAMRDRTVARTRMFALDALVRAQVRRERIAPANLDEFPPQLTTDPYTGLLLRYRASGPDFDLYSVGADFRDDGGRTDEIGERPDLVLEPYPR